MAELLKPIIEKATSGKFWLTIMIGVTFVYLSCSGKLAPDRSVEIILIVIYGYFTRQQTPTNGQGGQK